MINDIYNLSLRHCVVKKLTLNDIRKMSSPAANVSLHSRRGRRGRYYAFDYSILACCCRLELAIAGYYYLCYYRDITP